MAHSATPFVAVQVWRVCDNAALGSRGSYNRGMSAPMPDVPLPPILLALCHAPGLWLAGGWLRDAYWGMASTDVDLAAMPPLEPLLAQLSELTGSAPFRLNARFQSWRVMADGLTVDILPLADGGVEPATARRNYPVNTLMLPLAGRGSVDWRVVQAHPQAWADLASHTLRM